MKRSNIFFLLLALLSAGIISCTTPQKNFSGNYLYETECLGTENDGSQTVKAWGNGMRRNEAIDAARKNAVRDVLFKGIRNGRSDCNVIPVINEPNAREKYAEYFNTFFADDGIYNEYISKKYVMAKIEKGGTQSGSRKTYGVVVRVLRQDLINRMKKDGILN